MGETLGQQLAKARLARGLSVDEAAHETKVRPDKLVALERDDYSRFGNNAYAKGFLLIYGRFLKVDVADQVRALETPNDIHLAEYQYLRNAPAPVTEGWRRQRRGRKPSLAPLLAFAALIILGALGFYLYITAQRLGNLDSGAKNDPSARPSAGELATSAGSAPSPTTTPNAPAPPPAELRSPTASGATTPAASSPPPGAVIPAVPLTAPPVTARTAPLTTGSPATEGLTVRRAEPAGLTRVPATAPPPAAAAAPSIMHEVEIAAVRKTWVKIRKDDPNSEPIFMDYLYPNAGPLKLRGARFYIEAGDSTGLQIRKNGAPMAYQAPGITVQ